MPDTVTSNKIKYGLKNVHYAIATIGNDGEPTYGAVKPFPGAISVSLEPQGERYVLHADNIEYYVNNDNQGYEGDLETALITEAVAMDLLGEEKDADKILYEEADAAAIHFALLFQFEGDAKGIRHVFYNCTAARPTTGSETKGESIEAKTETLTITAKSAYFSAVEKNVVKARTADDTSDTIYNGWCSDVHTPTASATPASSGSGSSNSGSGSGN